MGNCIQKEVKAKRFSQRIQPSKSISVVSSPKDSSSDLNNTSTKSSLKRFTSKKNKNKKRNDSHGPSGEDEFEDNNLKKAGSKKDNKQKNNNSSTSKAEQFNKKKLEKLFDHYKDENPNEIDPNSIDDDVKEDVIGPDGGLAKFCKDLGIDGSADPVLFVFAYHCNCLDMMSGFSREEFYFGMQKLKLDSLEKVKSHLSVLRKELDDPDQLKVVYKWAFGFAKSEPSHKTVDKDVAIEIWIMLMGEKYYHVRKFVEYLRSEAGAGVKVINLDQWVNLYDFAITIKDDFSNYDEMAAWPCILDEYVQWTKDSESERNDDSKPDDDTMF